MRCTTQHVVDLPLRPTSSSPPEDTKKGKKGKRSAAPFLIGPGPAPPWPCIFHFIFFCRPPSLVSFFFFFLFLPPSSSLLLVAIANFSYFTSPTFFFSFPLRCDTPSSLSLPRKKFSLFSFLLKIPPALFFKKIPFLFRSSYTASLSYDFLITLLISLYNVL